MIANLNRTRLKLMLYPVSKTSALDKKFDSIQFNSVKFLFIYVQT
jgi:hypothetical protein